MTLPPRRRARVAFVNTHPIQYFAPLYRYVNAHSAAVEAIPIYLTDFSLRGAVDPGFRQPVTWDVDLLSGTDPVFAKGYKTRALAPGPTRMIAPDVWRIVRQGNFDAVVIHGHNIGANHVAWASAKSRGLPVFSRGEMHLELKRSGWKTRARDALMPLLFRSYDGFLTIGTANREYYKALGVSDARLHDFPYTVDNDRMIAVATLTDAERAEERHRLGLSADRFTLLYASKFLPRKHADHLIHAVAMLAERGVDTELVLAGSGEMEAELRALAAAHPGLTVHFPGFFNQSALPRLFAACDAFALPSEDEPWGLIVNEAMCASLPIIASREIGSVRDLVQDGVNGAVFEANDIGGLSEAILRVHADWRGPRRMGKASLDRIRNWGYRQCLEGLEAAMAAVRS